MRGAQIGSLTVYVVPANNTNGTKSGVKIWEITTEMGQNWFFASAPFTSSVPYYVSLEKCNNL